MPSNHRGTFASSVDCDQTQQSVAPDPGLHCLNLVHGFLEHDTNNKKLTDALIQLYWK